MTTVRAGDSIAHYEITAKLGEGGMGEVWRAKDSQLGREVALKVLPEAFTADPERAARFEREAKLLASLNHPNIAQIYGLEASGDTRALVMELVEGPTLADRLESGSLPLDESLSIARQIAEALEEAHEKGIIHRDLKPQNVKAPIEGKVKVLDFGLAKAMDPLSAASASASQLAASPTITLGATAQGVVLGTAAYMAPEQAKGFAVDKRADVWAFGVVLYQMLTGISPFVGDSVPDTLSRVLQRDVEFNALPPSTPGAIRRLLRRCLERHPKNRLHAIADARIVIDETLRGDSIETAPAPVTRPGFGAGTLAAVAAVAAVVAGGVGWWISSGTGREAPQAPGARLSVTLPNHLRVQSTWPGRSIAISPDGRDLVFGCASSAEDRSEFRLCRRSLDSYAIETVRDVASARQPFFSPDGRWIAYFTDGGGLFKVSLDSGKVLPVVPQVDGAEWGFGSWGEDGRIVFASWNSGLLSVSAEGGEVSTLIPFEGEWLEDPEVLPGARTVLYRARGARGARIEAFGLDTGERHVVLDNASHPRFAPPDRLLFVRGTVLMQIAFDPQAASVSGTPAPVAEEVALDSLVSVDPTAQLAVSRDGTLAFVAPMQAIEPQSDLIWIDRSGSETLAAAVPALVTSIDLSADARSALVATRHGSETRILLVDLERGTTTLVASTRPGSDTTSPIFLPGDRELLFTSSVVERVSLERAAVDRAGAAETLVELDGSYGAVKAVSNDGRYVVLSAYVPGRWSDIWYVDSAASEPKPVPFVATADSEHSPALSPDGRWLAYVSSESGDSAVYVRSFPDGGGKRRVSTAYGMDPLWARNGRELYYLDGGGSARQLIALSVASGPALELGTPSALFAPKSTGGFDVSRSFAATADGSRFLIYRSRGEGLAGNEVTAPTGLFDLRVVPRWTETLTGRGESP